MKNYDVAIIGLGPTGGTLANLIALGGFSVIVLDKEKSFYPLPRAVHFDDEVMRVFQTIGITNSFLNHTIINKGTKFVNSKGKVILDREKSFYPLPRAVHFDDEVMRVFQTIGIAKSFLNYTIINKGTKFVNSKGKVILDWPRPRKVTENGWYPSYRFNQPDLEKQLRKKLREYKRVEIKQNADVKKVQNINKDYVRILFKNSVDKKTQEVNAKYVIGCDGANSITRKLMGTNMDNLGFTQKWAVVDLILKKNKKNLPDRTIQYSNPNQPATYCRNVGKRRRWEFAIRNNLSNKKVLSEKYIWNFLKPWLKKKKLI